MSTYGHCKLEWSAVFLPKARGQSSKARGFVHPQDCRVDLQRFCCGAALEACDSPERAGNSVRTTKRQQQTSLLYSVRVVVCTFQGSSCSRLEQSSVGRCAGVSNSFAARIPLLSPALKSVERVLRLQHPVALKRVEQVQQAKSIRNFQ